MVPEEFPAPTSGGLSPGGRTNREGVLRMILVVDDEPDLARGLARILKSRGFDVVIAEGGIQAVELCRKHHPQAMLTDIKMPDMDGLALSREIKRIDPGAAVIFMTGYSDSEREALEEGAVAVLRKPLDYSLLFQILGQLGFA